MEQGPADEPTSELLKRKKASPCIEGPFVIPGNWVWVSVGTLAEARLGKMLDKNKNSGTAYRYLRNANVHWFDIRLDELKSMLLEDRHVDEYTLRVGDVLICEGSHGIGRTAVWRDPSTDIVFQKALHRVLRRGNQIAPTSPYGLDVDLKARCPDERGRLHF